MTPTLTRIEPSIVIESALPTTATIVGENLRLGMRLSLDNRNAAELEAPEITIGEAQATKVSYRDANQLDMVLPAALEPGVYDVHVTLSSKHRLMLTAALRVVTEDWREDDASASSGSQDRDSTRTDSKGRDSTRTDSKGRDSSTSGSNTSDAISSGSNRSDSNCCDDSTNGDEVSDSTSVGSASGSEDVGTNSDTPDASSTNTDTTQPEPNFRCAAGEFGPPELVRLQGFPGAKLWSPTLSSDNRTLYFTDGPKGTEALWVATRTDRGATFIATPAHHALFPAGVGTPYVSASGLALYFHSHQPNGLGGGDLYVATRNSETGSFASPVALKAVNSSALDYLAWVSPDERTIAFVSERDRKFSYFSASRPSRLEDFGAPAPIPHLAHQDTSGRLTLSADGLRAYFINRNRPGGRGSDDIWYATRKRANDHFEKVTNLSAVNTPGSEMDVTSSQDGEELFFIVSGASNQLYRSLASCP